MLIWILASFVVRGAVGLSLDGTSIYGPLSAPIVVLIWLYALAIAVLIGAGLNAATRELWPVAVRDSRHDPRLVEWARSEMERRRSYGEGEGDRPARRPDGVGAAVSGPGLAPAASTLEVRKAS